MALNSNEKLKGRVIDSSFLVFSAVVAVIFYLDSIGLSQRSAQVPRLIIYLILSLIAILSILVITGPTLDEALNIQMFENQVRGNHETEMDVPMIAKEVLIIVAYIVALTYVGYFTTSLLYAYLYIFAHGNETGLKRWVIPAMWALSINILGYVVFVYVIGSASIFQLGILI